MFFFLSTEMQFKAITKQSPLWDRLFWRSSCGRSTTLSEWGYVILMHRSCGRLALSRVYRYDLFCLVIAANLRAWRHMVTVTPIR
jgi:hypothetical protein